VQDLLRRWSLVSQRRNPAQMLDQASVPWFVELNRSLVDTLDDSAFRQRLRQPPPGCTRWATQMLQRASSTTPGWTAATCRRCWTGTAGTTCVARADAVCAAPPVA
jgi:hypothetical protein